MALLRRTLEDLHYSKLEGLTPAAIFSLMCADESLALGTDEQEVKNALKIAGFKERYTEEDVTSSDDEEDNFPPAKKAKMEASVSQEDGNEDGDEFCLILHAGEVDRDF